MKEFFLPVTEPLGAVWAMMAIGMGWLVLRRQWKSAIWLAGPTIVLFVLGSTALVERLVGREEERYKFNSPRATGHGTTGLQDYRTTDYGTTDHGLQVAGAAASDPVGRELRNALPSDTPAADAVVVLGGGVRMSHFDGFGFAATDAWSRVMTGIELVRTGRAKILVLGGSYPYPGKPQLPGMTAVQHWVNAWGLAGNGVTNLGICLNTHDEAVAFKKLKESQGWTSVILVTSALHMRRSEALFKTLRIEVEPVAADFEVFGVSQNSPFSVFPRQNRFRLWALYLHEKIGWIVYKAKRWV